MPKPNKEISSQDWHDQEYRLAQVVLKEILTISSELNLTQSGLKKVLREHKAFGSMINPHLKTIIQELSQS